MSMQVLYYNTNDFLNQMEKLQDEYTNLTYFYKYIQSKQDLLLQMEYLRKVELLTFSGFTGKLIIKIVIRDSYNKKYCIQYKFPKEKRKYNNMIRFLRQLEQGQKW